MAIIDPIADMLSMLKNGQDRGKSKIYINSSNIRKEIIKILKAEKYVEDFQILEPESKKDNKFEQIEVKLRYLENNKPFIRGLKRVSKPSKRVYVNTENIPVVLNHIGIAILSTNKGLMTDAQARKEHVGGEYLCKIW